MTAKENALNWFDISASGISRAKTFYEADPIRCPKQRSVMRSVSWLFLQTRKETM